MNEGQKSNRLKMHSPDPTEAIAVRLESAVKAGLKAMAERSAQYRQYDRSDDPGLLRV